MPNKYEKINRIKNRYDLQNNQANQIDKQASTYLVILIFLFYGILFVLVINLIVALILLLIEIIVLCLFLYKKYQYKQKKLSKRERFIRLLVRLQESIKEYHDSNFDVKLLPGLKERLSNLNLFIKNSDNYCFVSRGFKTDAKIIEFFRLTGSYLNKNVKQIMHEKHSETEINKVQLELTELILNLESEKLDKLVEFLNKKKLRENEISKFQKIWETFYVFDLRDHITTAILTLILSILIVFLSIKFNLLKSDSTGNLLVVFSGVAVLLAYFINPFSKKICGVLNATIKKITK